MTASHHRPGGSGDSRPASAAAPGSAPAREGAASADAPGADSPPPFPAGAIGLVVHARTQSRFPLRPLRVLSSRSLCAGSARALACRRRALEAVEKVVTGPTAYSHK